MSLCDRSIASEPVASVVVWTQTTATARDKAGQRPAPPQLRAVCGRYIHESRRFVLACLEREALLTRAEISEQTGLSLDATYAAIRWLHEHQHVIRTEGPARSKLNPVRWSVAR